MESTIEPRWIFSDEKSQRTDLFRFWKRRRNARRWSTPNRRSSRLQRPAEQNERICRDSFRSASPCRWHRPAEPRVIRSATNVLWSPRVFVRRGFSRWPLRRIEICKINGFTLLYSSVNKWRRRRRRKRTIDNTWDTIIQSNGNVKNVNLQRVALSQWWGEISVPFLIEFLQGKCIGWIHSFALNKRSRFQWIIGEERKTGIFLGFFLKFCLFLIIVALMLCKKQEQRQRWTNNEQTHAHS